MSLPLSALAGLVSCGSSEPPPVMATRAEGAAAYGPARRDEVRSRTMRGLADGSLGPQDRRPIEQLQLVLDSYTRAKRDVARAPEMARHSRAVSFCAQLNANFGQCVLFDGADEGAHLIGVEYVISRRLYESLPQSERQFWHAHAGDVDSGVMIAPGLSEAAQGVLMGELRSTYGKTWRTWDSEHDPLPFGEPTLLWSSAPARLGPDVRSEMRARKQQ
jgi:hypothetical protein